MRRNTDEYEDDGENWDDSEPDESADEDDDPSIPCPYCGQAVFEDSERCPYCESYISEEDAPAVRKPLWFIIGASASLAVVYIWIMYRQ